MAMRAEKIPESADQKHRRLVKEYQEIQQREQAQQRANEAELAAERNQEHLRNRYQTRGDDMRGLTFEQWLKQDAYDQAHPDGRIMSRAVPKEHYEFEEKKSEGFTRQLAPISPRGFANRYFEWFNSGDARR